jgi:hypothetical protein
MNRKSAVPIVFLVSVAILGVPGISHSEGFSWFDDFDDGLVSSEYDISSSNAMSVDYDEAMSYFRVNAWEPETVNHYDNPGVHSRFKLSRSLPNLADFDMSVTIAWDDIRDEVGDNAMQHLAVNLLDPSKNLVAGVGYGDPWINGYASRYSWAGGGGLQVRPKLPGAGSAEVGIKRTGQNIQVTWDGEVIRNGFNGDTVAEVVFEFGHYPESGWGGSAFGSLGIDSVSITGMGTVPHTPRLFSNCFGTFDPVHGSTPLEGGASAGMIASKVTSVTPMSGRATARSYDWESQVDVSEQVVTYANDFYGPEADSGIQPGDTYIFHANMHGDVAGVLWANASSPVCDWELAEQFYTPLWQEVNKIFVIDACHAEAFADDLLGLDNTFVLGACMADEETYYDPADGIGVFSKFFAEAIMMENGQFMADLDDDGMLALWELADSMAGHFDIVNGGWIDSTIDDDNGGSPHIYIRQSEDVDLMETWIVPEPGTLSLLAIGGLAMLRRRKSRWPWAA